MPYWSSSRVGAVPQQGQGQPSTSKPKKRSERFGRQQKGITMEDLKKQTALRLATEQQHRQDRYGGHGEGGGVTPNHYASSPSSNPREHAGLANAGGSGVVPHHHHHNNNNHHPHHRHPHPHAGQQHGHSPYQSSPPHASSVSTASSMEHGPTGPLMPSNGHGAPYHSNGPALTPRVDTRTSPTFSYDQRSKSSARVQANSTPVPSPPSKSYNSRSGKEQRPEVQQASSFTRTSSSTSADSATQSKQAKSKLPHGLTVQELKEMTRARLQAEGSLDEGAAENGGSSTTRPRNLQTPEPLGVPSTVSLENPSISRAASQASPVPAGFHQQNSSPRHADAWSQDSRGPEAWDNASVSTCASETYMSTGASGEMMIPSSTSQAAQTLDEYNASPFFRSRSYPVSSSNNHSFDSNHVPSQVNGSPPSPYFPRHQQGAPHMHVNGYGGGHHPPNRRRAQTLSPRAGLSYVHEDRPALVEAAGMIFLPQGSSHSMPPQARQQQHHMPHQDHSAFTPSAGLYPYGSSGSSGLFGGGEVASNVSNNRQRTSSTTSLPATTSTAAEFGIEQTTSSSSRFASQFGAAIREDQPLNVAPGLADVFRGSGFGTATTSSSTPAPLGLAMSGGGLSDGPLGISTSSSGGLYPGNIDDSRMRAATWSEPASSSATDAMFSGLLCGDQLSDDLASILKLSGAEDKSSGSGFDLLFSGSPGM